MSSHDLPSRRSGSVEIAQGDYLHDLRERRAMAQLEAEERRRRERSEQTSPLNDTRTRVRAWERAHGLTMPRTPGHPVLLQIAEATQLEMSEIVGEQLRRSATISGGAPQTNPVDSVRPSS